MFVRNVETHAGGTSDLVVVGRDSTTLDGPEIIKLTGSAVRLFSVDGGHTAEIVAHDMATAESSLADGGVVIADDVFNQEWPGVAEGTLRYLDGGGSLRPFAIGFNKVFFTTKDHVGIYRSSLVELAARLDLYHKQSVMMSHEVEIMLSWPHPIRRTIKRIPGAQAAHKLVFGRRNR